MRKLKYPIFALYLLLLPAFTFATQGGQVAFFHGQFTQKDLGNALIFSYNPKPNYLVGLDIGYKLPPKWQLLWRLFPNSQSSGLYQSAHLNLSYPYQGFHPKGLGLNPFLATTIHDLTPSSWPIKLGYTAGVGVSYYGFLPDKKAHLASLHTGQSAYSTRWLCYLMFEWHLSHPALRKWDIIWRIHHRSRCYGLFYPKVPGIHVGSDYFGLGLRYHF